MKKISIIALLTAAVLVFSLIAFAVFADEQTEGVFVEGTSEADMRDDEANGS